MNDLIKQLLTNPAYNKIIQEKLPPAFHTVEDELKGNPAVGLLREQVIIGMLIAFLGKDKVSIATSGVNPDSDCSIEHEPLSIKTVSNNGGIRLSWTSNATKAEQFINYYKPTCNLLVIRVTWGERGSIRYIPLDAQKSIFQQMGVDRYLDYRGGTNTRGVNLSALAENRINFHPDSVSLHLFWSKSSEYINPVDKWVEYWQGDNI